MHRSHAALILASAAVALAACGDEAVRDQAKPTPPSESRPSDSAQARSGASSESTGLRQIREDRNRLLDGGVEAFDKRLSELRGTPVVVNQWASWCPSCRAEFPIFQRVAAKLGDRVAFLGVDMKDHPDAARAFLSELPTPYPHYFDEDASISRLFGGGRVSPTTGFYDARGKLVFSHLGAYVDDAQLEAEIRRYVL
jgi:cytochrome c biogenesis protein CcmG/thiol:disulfide interchange protein DsbE